MFVIHGDTFDDYIGGFQPADTSTSVTLRTIAIVTHPVSSELGRKFLPYITLFRASVFLRVYFVNLAHEDDRDDSHTTLSF